MLTPLGIGVWIAIGLSIGLAAMIFPFKRGVKGVVLNALVSIGGGFIGGFAGAAMGIYDRPTHPDALAMVAVSSLIASLIAHVVPLHNTDRHSEK